MANRQRKASATKAAQPKQAPQKDPSSEPAEPSTTQAPRRYGSMDYDGNRWNGMDIMPTEKPTKSAQLIADREAARRKGTKPAR